MIQNWIEWYCGSKPTGSVAYLWRIFFIRETFPDLWKFESGKRWILWEKQLILKYFACASENTTRMTLSDVCATEPEIFHSTNIPASLANGYSFE